MRDDHLLVEARSETRRSEENEESAARRASEALAERLQRDVETFLRRRTGAATPDA